MIRSMTGFGRCEKVTEQYKISVEMKAVNHRYLDLSIKMPKRFNYFESGVRGLLKTYIQRGKVDIFISYEDYTKEKLCLKYNESLAAEYVQYFKQMSEAFAIDNDMTAGVLARMPEVLTMEQEPEDEDAMWKLLSEAIEEAAKRFVESRTVEGESLKADLLGKLKAMEDMVACVEQRTPAIVAEYQARLEAKVKELLGTSGIDEGRIVTEVTIFADKVCVDEEIVRLKSHISHMESDLLNGGGVGRKLDFLAQEMNREANTILSKANDLTISDKAIALKTEIEKIREQIQNIE
ncbi:MAG: YicC family protein [Hungatella sp.]|nr:YicC family protein [Hungatella sp.]